MNPLKIFSIGFLLLLIFSHSTFSQTKQDTLTNQKIINMAKSGLSDLIIKKSISNANIWSFDLSSDGLLLLKKGSVSDTIISAMFDKGEYLNKPVGQTSQNISDTTKKIADSKNKNAIDNLSPGIYYKSDKNNNTEYTRLNWVKPSAELGMSPTSAYNRYEYLFLGNTSLFKVSNPSPEFFLVIGSGYDNILYQPTQFIVLEAKQKKDKRIILGNLQPRRNLTSKSMSDFDPKYIIKPVFTKINEQLFKITFANKLSEGNYFFGPTNVTYGTIFLEFDIIK